MRSLFRSAVFAAAFYSFAASVVPAQKNMVDERNVRAEMNFLASDAMQGRGSGTIFERVAAEYIGSQFMQFGLEPAGKRDASGKQTYVQTVEVTGRPVLEKLRIPALAGYQEGVDWLVLSISAPDISGNFTTLTLDQAAKPGEIVLVILNEDDKLETIQPRIAQFYKDGAVAVLITQTKELREHWAELAKTKRPLSRRGTLIAITDNVATTLSMYKWESPLEFHAKFSDRPKSATWNAMGKITGSDPTLSSEVILLTSHLDHLGVRDGAPGDDKIFNGADDDASGSIAVLELARLLGGGEKPKRTVYFVCFGSEEAGGYGATFFVNNLPFAKNKLVANLEFEMIGRPDQKVKPDELWLTGYERTNLGPELVQRGAKLVKDPHPDQNFFQRSDNITLARQGIVAQTVSSFGLHSDYHQPSDEIKTIDFFHMTSSINSMVKPIEWLINTRFKPSWNEGQRP